MSSRRRITASQFLSNISLYRNVRREVDATNSRYVMSGTRNNTIFYTQRLRLGTQLSRRFLQAYTQIQRANARTFLQSAGNQARTNIRRNTTISRVLHNNTQIPRVIQNPNQAFPRNFNSYHANMLYDRVVQGQPTVIRLHRYESRNRRGVITRRGVIAYRSVDLNDNIASTLYQLRLYPNTYTPYINELRHLLDFINTTILPQGYVILVSNLFMIPRDDPTSQGRVNSYVSRTFHLNGRQYNNMTLKNTYDGLIDSPNYDIDYSRTTFFIRLVRNNAPGGCFSDMIMPKYIKNPNKTRSIFFVRNNDDTCGQHVLYLCDMKSLLHKDYLESSADKENKPELYRKYKKRLNKTYSNLSTRPASFTKKVKGFIAKYHLHTRKMTPLEMTEEHHKLHPTEDLVFLKENLDSFDVEHHNAVQDYSMRHYILQVETQKKYRNDEGQLVIENGFHFNYVKDVNLLYTEKKQNNKIVFCEDCLTCYDKRYSNHRCSVAQTTSCSFCKKRMSIDEMKIHKTLRTKKNCPTCNHCCYGEECYNEHIKICKGKKWFCINCFNPNGTKCGIIKNNGWFPTVDKSKNPIVHNCATPYCSTCDCEKPHNHRCIIPKRPISKTDAVKGDYAVFDIETDPTNNHEVLQWGAKTYPSGEEVYCDSIVNKKSPIEQLYDWIFQKREGRSAFTIIAHNFKGYDGQLLYHYIVKHKKRRPTKMILAGAKIMYMSFGTKIRFIDSLNHIAAPLSSFPKMWGIKSLVKGEYPYEFNTRANSKYVGKIPPLVYGNDTTRGFRPDDMKPNKRKKFLEWYDERKKRIWNHKIETKAYCMDDVRILYEGIKKYVELGIQTSGLNPLKSTTIASYCMNVFKTKDYDNIKYPQAVLDKKEYYFIKRSFFGGRTEVFRKLVEGQECQYTDIQSLYPNCQYFKQLPYGIPKWRMSKSTDNSTSGLKNIEAYIHNLPNEGKDAFFEVDVECPKQLHIPVLPGKEKLDGGDKLVFSLNDKQKRVYYGVELRESLNQGYKIKRFYKSLEFKTTDQFFKTYIRRWLEIKVNASKKPDMSENEYQIFCERHKKEFGFTPNQSYNPGLRALSKLCLNSLWGKWGQRPNLPQSEWINKKNKSKFYMLLKKAVDGYVDIKEILDDVDGSIYIQFAYNEEKLNKLEGLKSTNIALASAITSNARICLYSHMKNLGERICYCDTDSVVYIVDKNNEDNNIKIDNFLGGMELEDDGIFNRFVATAPKCYAYIGEKEHTKSKGITLTYCNSKLINYNTLKNLVVNKEEILTERNMRFPIKESVMTTIYQPKLVKMNGDKRVFSDVTYNSRPYGYVC